MTQTQTLYYVFHHGNGHIETAGRFADKSTARAECANLNEREREANNGKLDGGHYFTTDAND